MTKRKGYVRANIDIGELADLRAQVVQLTEERDVWKKARKLYRAREIQANTERNAARAQVADLTEACETATAWLDGHTDVGLSAAGYETALRKAHASLAIALAQQPEERP